MSVHEPFHFHSLDELRQRISELGLDIPVVEDLSPLFDAVPVGNFTLPNRFVVLPMEGCDGKADGAPDELTFRRYRRFAAGGAGLLWMEACAVVPEGRANPRQLWIHEATVGEFARLVSETLEAARHTMGPNHRPLLILQLTHSGRYSKPGRRPAPIIAHHSKYLDAVQNLPPDYPLITDDALKRLEDAYVEAARCANQAGFDGVDIKACHRYLISELHASHTRQRSQYGGSFENRTRFLRNVVAKIRDAFPRLIVTSRMNAYDAMAYPYGFGVDQEDAAKPDLSEPADVVRFLRDSGAPVVNITIGNPYYNPYVNRPFDLPTAGAPLPPESPIEGVARFLAIVRHIQAEVPELPVVGGGYSWLRQFFPHVAAAAVRNGWVSLVGMGRMAFAYPEAPRELAQHGRLDPERVCVACSACTQIMRDGGRSGCVPRDAAIYEPIYKAGRAEAWETVLAMAKTCLQCNDPTCRSGCPAHVDIPKFVGQIANRQFRGAYETIREANVLAAVCGYVCPAETLCEAACINQHYSESVPIRHLQRWVGRMAVEEGWASEFPLTNIDSGKRVAVLGAGPAGISAAVTLASHGHSVTLLDPASDLGGVAQETIPPERLPLTLLHREISDVLAASGRVNRRGARLGPFLTLDHLRAEGFDAMLIAIGLSVSQPLPGARRPDAGVEGALEFLARVKRGDRVEGKVLVLGGGNTAVDAAVSAKRAGASDVFIIYRRSFAEMPAWPEERDQAMRAGVHFLILTQPLKYAVAGDGRLVGVEVIRTHLGAPGPDGRRRPAPIPGSEHLFPADVVVEAIGQTLSDEVRQALTGIELTKDGLVRTKEGSLATSRAGVYAAGDIVNGGATVVDAVAQGARAAREIDAWLRGAN